MKCQQSQFNFFFLHCLFYITKGFNAKRWLVGLRGGGGGGGELTAYSTPPSVPSTCVGGVPCPF